jgi:hydroxyacylglutathione hydrolase
MFLRQIPDESLAQYAYLIGCQRTGEAVVIDPERDVDRYLAVAAENGFRLTAVVETHIHADYLSGARELVERHGAWAYLSAEGGPDWQFEWAKGKNRVTFLRDGDAFKVGNIELKAMLSAGHTPEHLSYLVTDLGGGANEPMALLSGDFIFVGDVGRPDLLESAAGQAGVMEPSARQLYHSLRATALFPEHVQILPAHGAGSACGKELGAVPFSVLGYERRFNRALREAMAGNEEVFVQDILSGQPEPPLYFARMKRDNKLGPALLPAGKLPVPKRLLLEDAVAMAKDGAYAWLDLRSDRSAFMQRHISGSLFSPLAGGKLPLVAGSYLTEEQKIVLLVSSGDEVEEGVRQLIRIGLDHVIGWIPVAELLEVSDVLSSQRTIMTPDLATALAEHAGARVLDVRGAAEYGASHVKGAKNIAYTRLSARIDEVPEGSPLYVHCGSGLRAAFACSFLASRGYEVVYVNGAFAEIPASIRS